MYPKNAASPQRVAIGPVVQISDGAVQTSGVSVKVMPQGGAAGAGGGTIAYEEGIVHYIPTQAETNYASFMLIAYKTGCIPATCTVVTSASGTAGYAGLDWSAISAPTTTVNLSGTTIKTATDIEVDTGTDIPALIAGIGTAGGAAINVDATTDNYSAGISGVTSGTTRVGTQTGTFASSSFEDGVYHVMTHSGNAIDIVYQFLSGGGTTPVGAIWTGYVSGANDTVTISAWNHVGAAWEAIGSIVGQAGTTNITKTLTLYPRHSGTSSAELGKIYLRLHCTGMTSPVLNTDSFVASYSVTSRTVGYEDGAVWLDTNDSNTSTEAFVSGTADNNVSTLAAALTIAASIGSGLERIHVLGGSSVTLAGAIQGFTFTGNNWTLALGGVDATGCAFEYASNGVSGTCTGTFPFFKECAVGAVTVPPCAMDRCGLTSTVTIGSAGDFFLVDCFSQIAGSSSPVIDFAGVGATNMCVRRWSGGLTLNNLAAGDVVSIDAVSGGTITVNGTGGSVNIRGLVAVSDGSGGLVTIVKTQAVSNTSINAEVDTAFTDYDPPTNAEFEARTPSAAQLTNIVSTGADWINGGRLDLIIDAILEDTGTTLPGQIDDIGIKKNTAFSNFEFLMVLAADHVTPATGLTVTGQRSIDGGAFASVSGTIAEVSNGIYQFDAAAADTNGDVITWRFSSATADDAFITFKTVA